MIFTYYQKEIRKLQKHFLEKPLKLPFVVNVDKSGTNKAALEAFNKDLGKKNATEIRQCKYLNNLIEQDHHFIKKRLKPMLWLKSYEGAAEVISGIELVQMLRKGQLKGINGNKSTYDQFVSSSIMSGTQGFVKI